MVHADSAGIPFEGRAFHANPHTDDDGGADPALAAAIARFRAGDAGIAEVVAAVGAARVLVPLVAEKGDEGIGPFGQRVDKTQELSMVQVAAPDGRAALPAFTSVGAMAAWDAGARPVPVTGARLALAAAGEGVELVVLDAGGPDAVGLRRPCFEAIATGTAWRPCFEDEEVLEAFLDVASAEAAVRGLQLAPGDPEARLTAPELLVQLHLAPGLVRDDLEALARRLHAAWLGHPLIAARVDSIALRFAPA